MMHLLLDQNRTSDMSDGATDSANEQVVASSAMGNDDEMAPRLKLRRCRSTSKAETIVTEDEKMRRAQPDKP